MNRSIHWIFTILLTLHALQNHNKKEVKDQIKKRALVSNRFAVDQDLRPKKKEKQKLKRSDPLHKTGNLETVLVPEPEGVLIDRDDHVELPDFTDNPPIVLSMAPADFLPVAVTSVLVKTVVKAAKTTVLLPISKEKPVVQITRIEAPVTATLAVAEEILYTTITLPEESQQKVSTRTNGWVIVTSGVIPEEKNNQKQQNQQRLVRDKNVLFGDDALPDALQVVSNLWHDEPVFVTETIYITTRLIKAQSAKKTPTTTTRQLKKFEKRTAKTSSTSHCRVNTNMIKIEPAFTIAPDDVYRGIHAKSSGDNLALSGLLTALSTIIVALLFA